MPTTLNNANYGATTLRYSGDQTFGSITAELNLSTADQIIGASGEYPYQSTSALQNEVDNIAGLDAAPNGAQSTTTLQSAGSSSRSATTVTKSRSRARASNHRSRSASNPR